MSDDDGMALLRLSANGTDGEWYAETGACGGCGDARCHDGPCVEDAWGLPRPQGAGARMTGLALVQGLAVIAAVVVLYLTERRPR
jgi:hypothetical protein